MNAAPTKTILVFSSWLKISVDKKFTLVTEKIKKITYINTVNQKEDEAYKILRNLSSSLA